MSKPTTDTNSRVLKACINGSFQSEDPLGFSIEKPVPVATQVKRTFHMLRACLFPSTSDGLVSVPQGLLDVRPPPERKLLDRPAFAPDTKVNMPVPKSKDLIKDTFNKR